MEKFEGKIALVGGNLGRIKKNKFILGLGGAIAKRLISGGCAKVFVIDTEEVISQQCVKFLGDDRIESVHCDLFTERTFKEIPFIDDRGRDKIDIEWLDFPALDMVKNIVKKYGKIDILVTNFDKFEKARVELSSEELYSSLRDKMIWPVFHLLAAVREQFKAQMEETGVMSKVVMVTSVFGKAGLSLGSIYSAFSGSIVSLTKCLAREFSRFANVNAIACGPLAEKKMQGPKDRVVSSFISTATELADQPLSLEEVAPTVVFLASKDASCITGQILNVDQGLWLKLES